jgi:hypothetical protein
MDRVRVMVKTIRHLLDAWLHAWRRLHHRGPGPLHTALSAGFHLSDDADIEPTFHRVAVIWDAFRKRGGIFGAQDLLGLWLQQDGRDFRYDRLRSERFGKLST